MAGITLPKFNFHFNLPFLNRQSLSVGLDIGSHSIKACELATYGKGFRLISLGSARLPQHSVEDGVLQNPDAVAKTITALTSNLKLAGRKVAISISGYSVIVKKINLEVMNEQQLEAHIRSEAEQYIPFDIDEVYLDFQDLKTNSASEERTDVMLVAAKKDVVDAYLALLRSVGLKTVIVDVDAFALENAYGSCYGMQDNVVLVDIGASKMNINIISNGNSVLARDVILGSGLITEQIQNRFGFEYDDAEALKIGLKPPGKHKEQLEEIFVSICTQWITEIKRALDFYATNHADSPISNIILSGGGSKTKGLDKFFSMETGIPAEVFNPFRKVDFNASKINPAFIKIIAPEMALSAGLATRPVTI